MRLQNTNFKITKFPVINITFGDTNYICRYI